MTLDSHKGQHSPSSHAGRDVDLIAINVAVFLYEVSLDPEDLEQLMYLFGVVPARYTHPAWASS